MWRGRDIHGGSDRAEARTFHDLAHGGLRWGMQVTWRLSCRRIQQVGGISCSTTSKDIIVDQ